MIGTLPLTRISIKQTEPRCPRDVLGCYNILHPALRPLSRTPPYYNKLQYFKYERPVGVDTDSLDPLFVFALTTVAFDKNLNCQLFNHGASDLLCRPPPNGSNLRRVRKRHPPMRHLPRRIIDRPRPRLLRRPRLPT